MPLVFERTIDLTAYADNPEPKLVEQLSIIHESSDGEIVQYYIKPVNKTQGDKNSHAIGVYDEDSQTWSYHEYEDLEWGKPGQRISGNRIERLGIKAFPAIGAIAFYKLAHRKLTRIVAPVNPKSKKNTAPDLAATVNADGTVTFTVTPPEEPEYECYRIVMDYDIYTEEYITYDLELTVEKPRISGEYRCYAVGYGEEGQLYSKESNVVVLDLEGRDDEFHSPFYSRADIDRLTTMKDLTFTGHQSKTYNGKTAVSVEIPENSTLTFTGHQNKSYDGSADVSVEIPRPAVLYGTEEPDAGSGINGSVYVQYEVVDNAPKITAEWIKLEGVWVRKGGGDGSD